MIKTIRKVLKVFDENHLWDEGVELIGSWCFHLYQRHLGVKVYPFRTLDVDFLIPYPYKGKTRIKLVKKLKELGFKHDFKSDGSIYLWSAELKIEFIIPERGRGFINPPIVKQLSLKAIPLRYVDILLEDPIYVKEGGVKVLVPNPAAFCLQKLLIVSKRKKPEKKLKDLEQAIHTYKIAPTKKIKQIYVKFPRPWRKRIIQCLEKEKKNLPLLKRDIDRMIITLQNIENDNL